MSRLTPHLARAALATAWLALAASGAVVANPAPGSIDQRQTCLACHDDLAASLAARVPHVPARDGQCTACHNPHVSRFDALLQERPAVLCLECHADLEPELERAHVHAPVAEGRCADCHTPHGGANAKLLTEPRAELCGSCHSELAEWRARPVQHAPFAQGSCAGCHEPHAGDYPGQLAKPVGEVCATCHRRDAGFTRAHAGYPVERADCRQCHDPHASARAGLFRKQLHAPFEQGECTTCHALAGSSDPFRTRLPLAELCGECHEERVTGSQTAMFPHITGGGADCVDCHNPHTADGAALVDGPVQSVCLGCHDPGGASSGAPGRHASHAELDCTTCHTPHGGERPVLLAGAEELCSSCHEHQHSAAHPIGEEVRDPRTGVPMTCTTCHGIHVAPYSKYLHRSEERELCVSCHKKFGGGR